jgi:pyrimidine-nucleoside phosphorylase
MRIDLDIDELRSQVERSGLAIAAATADLVPADKRIYALRDVTGTVPSPALIAASVMSKKLAGGAAHVLLDVKTGDGAFMVGLEAAVELARLCVDIGVAHGRRTGALVTDMSEPLGDGVGNALEVAVAVETLRGERHGRFRTVCLALAAATLELTGEAPEPALERVRSLLDSGAGLEAFRTFVVAQGGDPAVADRPREVLARAPHVVDWVPGPGIVQGLACRRIGELAGSLGAGRRRRDDVIDPAVGLEVLVRTGDEVGGVPAVRVHAARTEDAERVLAVLPEVVAIGPAAREPAPTVHARIGLAGADGPPGAAGAGG